MTRCDQGKGFTPPGGHVPTQRTPGGIVRKIALGALLALVLAAFPIGTAAVAAGASDVRIVYASNGNQPAKIFVSGLPGSTTVLPSTGIDVALPAGTYTVLACTTTTTAVSGTTCTGGLLLAGSANNLVVSGDSNYTFTMVNLTGAAPVAVQQQNTFQNDLSITGLNEARFTLNNALTAGSTVDICIDGIKILTNVAPNGGQGVADVPADQAAGMAVVVPTGGACGSSSDIPLVAGTNFVLTLVAADPAATPLCTSGCAQVLLVGQDTVPHNTDTAAFCDAILLGLATVQPALKALVGDVDPTTTTTITNTQPSVGDMMTFVNDTQDAIDAGDATVPASIKPSWVIATSGLRDLLAGFKLVNFNLVGLGQPAVKSLVLGANGVSLPGVPPNPETEGATEAITAFVLGTCLAGPAPGPEPTPGPPTPAAEETVSGAPRLTG